MSGRHELPDDRPVEWPLGISRPLTIQEEIARFVRVEMSQRAAASDLESFEEADDFDVEDEEEFVSPYEMTEMQEDAVVQRKSVDKSVDKPVDNPVDNPPFIPPQGKTTTENDPPPKEKRGGGKTMTENDPPPEGRLTNT